MSLSLAELRAVAASLRPRLVGGQLQRIVQPDEDTLVLTIRGRRAGVTRPDAPEEPLPGAGATWELLLSVRPRESRVHLTWQELPLPPSPPAFAQRLRKLVENGWITGAEVPWTDRVFALHVAHADQSFQILLEITGHHANAFLLDAEGTILQTMRPTASRRRDLRPGQPYVPPLPPDEGAALRSAGETPSLGGEALHRALDDRYASRSAESTFSARLQALAKRVRTARDRSERRRAKVADDQARAAEADTLRHFGELLKTALHAVPRGASRISLPDLCHPEAGVVDVPLRPDLSPRANLEALFVRYRKLTRALPAIAQRLREAETEVAALTSLTARLDALHEAGFVPERAEALEGALEEALRAARAAGVATGPLHAPRRPAKERPARHVPYRTFHAADGTPILVGRAGADNATLTFRVARDNDPWLHVRDRAGSHVVVRRASKSAPVTRETLLDAAVLAAHFSKARDDTSVEVHVTPRRHVRPAKDAPPGTVRVERSDTLVVRPDPVRLARLLATADEG